jgi:hypothetical protein
VRKLLAIAVGLLLATGATADGAEIKVARNVRTFCDVDEAPREIARTQDRTTPYERTGHRDSPVVVSLARHFQLIIAAEASRPFSSPLSRPRAVPAQSLSAGS